MDETLIIMLKNKETGFLEKEIASCSLNGFAGLVSNAYAEDEDDNIKTTLDITCGRELEDWEYDAVFDYYDEQSLAPFVSSFCELDGGHNPAWRATIINEGGQSVLENSVLELLKAHNDELESVYEAIADKRNDYINE